MIRVLITDGMDSQAVAQLKEKGFEVTEQHYSQEELGPVMKEYDAMVVRSATKVTAGLLEGAKGSRLRLVIRGGVGVDNIDLPAAKAAGIEVRNTPKSPSRSVAELALAHMLSCSRFISAAGHTMREGKWEKKAYSKGMELKGKTLGVWGFGRIGQQLCQVAKALGMEVLAFDIYQAPGLEAQLGFTYVPLDELLAKSDFVSLHAPAVDGGPLVTRETIAKMKDGAVLINTSRGTNVDEDALLEALNSGKLRAAGLDVYQQEPPVNQALCCHPQVSCTPHIGSQTAEAQNNIGQEIVEVLTGFFRQ